MDKVLQSILASLEYIPYDMRYMAKVRDVPTGGRERHPQDQRQPHLLQVPLTMIIYICGQIFHIFCVTAEFTLKLGLRQNL